MRVSQEAPTPRQRLILDYVDRFVLEHGYAPSIRQVAAAVALKTPSAARYQIQQLERKGLLSTVAGISRSLRRADACVACGRPFEPAVPEVTQ